MAFIDSKARTTIECGEDLVIIRAKMSIGVKAKLFTAYNKLSANGAHHTPLAYELELLVHNIVAWSGPTFEKVKCNELMIRRLDPNWEYLGKIVDAISEANKPPTAPPEPAEEPEKKANEPST